MAAEPDNKIKDDDIDLALDALRNCDTDFIKFDEVCIIISICVTRMLQPFSFQANSVSN